MAIIENFAELSFEEQKAFADELLKTINSESTFIDGVKFDVAGVEADEFSGGLIVMVSHEPLIEVTRRATWQAKDKEAAEADPGYEVEYDEFAFEDAKTAFKTMATEIAGYAVTLEIHDVEKEEFIGLHIDKLTDEDAGIGDYEYWGAQEHDSRPYVEARGTLTYGYACDLVLYVEPMDTVEPDTEEDY